MTKGEWIERGKGERQRERREARRNGKGRMNDVKQGSVGVLFTVFYYENID